MQIVTAIPAESPLLPVPVPYFLLGGFVGLVLTAIVLLVIDHLNDSLKSVGQIEELLGLPVLEFVSTKKFIRSELVSAHNPLTSEINALDDLAVQIDLIAMDKNVRTLLVTNIGPEGVKTTIAANLAIIFAQRGKRVVLLDGDLRQPHLQTIFGIENKTGVIGLLNGDIDPTGVIRVVDDNHSFAVIPSGTEPGKLIRWPDADNLTHLFSKLQKQADLIIVDGPTAEKVDTQMLASQVDAVLILIKSDHTHAAACQAALKRFQLVGGSVIGAILFSTHKIRQ
jgi:capsular exopolysaccharide synthesis family protein